MLKLLRITEKIHIIICLKFQLLVIILKYTTKHISIASDFQYNMFTG